MRTITCDRCGKEIGPNAVPAALLAGGGYTVHADLCAACFNIVRSDLLALVEGWKPERGAA